MEPVVIAARVMEREVVVVFCRFANEDERAIGRFECLIGLMYGDFWLFGLCGGWFAVCAAELVDLCAKLEDL